VNRVLTVLIASAFAAGSSLALAQATPGTSAAEDSTTSKQRKSEAFADKQRTLEEQSRSSASGAVTTGDDSNVDNPLRSGDKAKDFAEREKAFSKASRSSASGHNEGTKTRKLTQEERRAIQKEAEKQRAAQSRR